jgi:Flp pilus assembly pilin Flp
MSSLLSSRKSERGQGVLEYIVILAVAAVVIIALIRIMGPAVVSIKDTDTNAPVWTFAANEGGVINVPEGEHQIQYGTNDAHFTRTFMGPALVECNNDTFGDPQPHSIKTCFIQ